MCSAPTSAVGAAPSLSAGRQVVEQQPRVDRVGAEADQAGEVVDLARLAGVDDQRQRRAQARADELLVHGARSRAATGSRARVRPTPRSVSTSSARRCARLRGAVARARATRGRSALGADVDRRGRRRARRCGRCAGRRASTRSQLSAAQHRPRQPHAARGGGRVAQQSACGPSRVRQRHHDLLAQRVDRRVGDLREQLAEVGEQRRAALRQRGQRARRRPSSRSAPCPVRPSAPKHDLEVLARVAERRRSSVGGPLRRRSSDRRSPAGSSASGRIASSAQRA